MIDNSISWAGQLRLCLGLHSLHSFSRTEGDNMTNQGNKHTCHHLNALGGLNVPPGQGTPATVFCQSIFFQTWQLALSSALRCAGWTGGIPRGVRVFHSLLAVVAEGCPDKELHGMQKAVVLGKAPWCPSGVKPMVKPELDLTQIHLLFVSSSIFLCQARVAATAGWLLAHRADATPRAPLLETTTVLLRTGWGPGRRQSWI